MPTNSERHGGKSAEVEERRGRGRVIRSGDGGGDGCKTVRREMGKKRRTRRSRRRTTRRRTRRRGARTQRAREEE